MIARPELTRPLGLSLLSLVVVAPVLPPEVSGGSLGGCAVLVALAAVLAAATGHPRTGAWGLVAVLPCLALLGRFGMAPGGSVEPIATVILAVAAFVAASAAAKDRLPERLAGALALGGAVVGTRAVYEAAWGLGRLAAEARDRAPALPDAAAIAGRLEQGRAYAGFATPAAAGGFLALALCATVALGISRTGRSRVLIFLAAAVQAGGLLSTRSLTAAASLLVALAILAAASRSRPLGAAVAALILAIGLLGALRAGQVFSRASDDSPWRLRAGNVRIGLAIASAHPWLGVGPGGYAEAFPSFRRQGDNESRHAHCLPVELVADLGWIPGLAAASVFFVLFLGPLTTGRFGRGTVERGIAVGLAGFALHNLADFTAFVPSVLWVACVLRGAMSPADGELPAPEWAPRLAWAGCVLGAAALLVGAGVSADAREQARRDVLFGEAPAAMRGANRAVFWAPWNADAVLLRAQILPASRPSPGELVSAAADADRAVLLAPNRAAARAARARIRGLSGDLPGAFADLSAAAALHPLRTEYAERKAEAAAALPRPPDASSPQ